MDLNGLPVSISRNTKGLLKDEDLIIQHSNGFRSVLVVKITICTKLMSRGNGRRLTTEFSLLQFVYKQPADI